MKVPLVIRGVKMVDKEKNQRFEEGEGFIAALDQSGGSTPKALRQYGIEDSEWETEDEMFDLIHQARSRIIASPSLDGDRILGAILFEGTLGRDVDGVPVAEYLWEKKKVLPFLKIDKGLAEEADGVQLMVPIPGLKETLEAAAERGVYGTKERSVIHAANPKGIQEIVDQQFEVAREVLDAGLMPIVEPEVSIVAPDKEEAEEILKADLIAALNGLGDEKVALKLTLPTKSGFYSDLVAHPNVSRVVALSGGYDREKANVLLAENPGVIASFSRALLEGLSAQQSEEDFDRTLDESIEGIYQASIV